MSEPDRPGEDDGIDGDPDLLKADRKEQGEVESDETDTHVHTEDEDADAG